MNLYIDSDRNFQTGWCGYDYRINASREEGYCTVEKTTKDFSGYSQIGYAKYKMEDNKLMIWVPATLIPLGKAFEFKWADNSVSAGDPMQFMDQGDAAPDDRFNFLYLCDETLKDPEETKPSPSPSPSPSPTPKPTPAKTPPKGGSGGGGGGGGVSVKTPVPTKAPSATATPGPTESPAAAIFSDLEGYAWASEAVYELARAKVF